MAEEGRLLSIVQNYAANHTISESHLEELKKKSLHLVAQLESANATLQAKKLRKNSLLEDVKCLEVELAASEASIKSRQSRLLLQQEEIAQAKSEVEKLQRDEIAQRDIFVAKLLELNQSIRNMHDYNREENLRSVLESLKMKHKELAGYEGKKNKQIIVEEQIPPRDSLETEEEELAKLRADLKQKHEEENSFKEQYGKLNLELELLNATVKLMDSLSQTARELQALSTANAALETEHAYLSEEYQRLHICPQCGMDNIGPGEEAS